MLKAREAFTLCALQSRATPDRSPTSKLVYELNARLRPMSGLGFGVRGFDRLVYSVLRHSALGGCALMIASKRERYSCVQSRLTADCPGVGPRQSGPAAGIRPIARESAGSCLHSTYRIQVPSSDLGRGH